LGAIVINSQGVAVTAPFSYLTLRLPPNRISGESERDKNIVNEPSKLQYLQIASARREMDWWRGVALSHKLSTFSRLLIAGKHHLDKQKSSSAPRD